jgi:hypothetical protein
LLFILGIGAILNLQNYQYYMKLFVNLKSPSLYKLIHANNTTNHGNGYHLCNIKYINNILYYNKSLLPRNI